MYLYSYAALTVYVISAVISGREDVFSKHPLCLLDCGSESSEG